MSHSTITNASEETLRLARLLAEELICEGPPVNHPWWTEESNAASTELEVNWAIERIVVVLNCVRIDEARWWRHQSHDGAICSPQDCIYCARIANTALASEIQATKQQIRHLENLECDKD